MSQIGLLTGSEPFAGLPDNPASEVLPEFEGRQYGDLQIVTKVMPVSLTRLPETIEALIEEYRPTFVVSLGLATGHPTLRLERCGINIADFGVADNEGATPRGEAITPQADGMRVATWDAPALTELLLEHDLPASTSWHAGTHLCNLTLYCFLGALARAGLETVPCGFLHLPYTPRQVTRFLKQARTTPDTAPLPARMAPSMPLSMMQQGIDLMLEHLAKGTVR